MNDFDYMSRALKLARRGLYTTRQNPRVGCVIVKDDEIVGEGFHNVPGGPHAEINALYAAGERARGATVYVTLEPCAHHGKTPPCADTLIAAGVRQVVVAMTDPNPLVAGQGIKRLQDAGISVREGVMSSAASELNPGFIKRMTQGLPLVRVKLAMSLDGRTAMASGESQWITGPAARADVHRWRARSCAILTGSGTVLADNPGLTFRLDEHESLRQEIPADTQQPLRVVCDSTLKIPADSRIIAQPGKTLIATIRTTDQAREWIGAGAEVISLPENGNKVSLSAVMQELSKREINEVLVEAGPGMAGALLAEGLVDELLVYMAPHLMGDQAHGLVTIPGLETMSDRIPLKINDIRAVGTDWRIAATPVYG